MPVQDRCSLFCAKFFGDHWAYNRMLQLQVYRLCSCDLVQVVLLWWTKPLTIKFMGPVPSQEAFCMEKVPHNWFHRYSLYWPYLIFTAQPAFLSLIISFCLQQCLGLRQFVWAPSRSYPASVMSMECGPDVNVMNPQQNPAEHLANFSLSFCTIDIEMSCPQECLHLYKQMDQIAANADTDPRKFDGFHKRWKANSLLATPSELHKLE